MTDVQDVSSGATPSLYPEPKAGTIWFNTNRQELFLVLGMVAPCTDAEDEWEVLYRSLEVPTNRFRRRSLEEWYGTNRYGQPRFIPLTFALTDEMLTVAKALIPIVPSST